MVDVRLADQVPDGVVSVEHASKDNGSQLLLDLPVTRSYIGLEQPYSLFFQVFIVLWC
jgi:hypothetical protein